MSSSPPPDTPVPATALPETLPVLPLKGMVVFPLAIAPIAVGQPRSVRLVDDVMRGDRLLVVVTQRDEAVEQAGPDDLYPVGTVAVIHQLARAGDGSLRLVVQGLERVRLLAFTGTDPYLVARIERPPEQTATGTEVDALRRAAVDLFRRLVALTPELPAELGVAAENTEDGRQLAYLIASIVPMDAAVRQDVLELDPVAAKLRRLVDPLQRELAVRELGKKITTETEERLSKSQREFYLREQLRSIQRELGEEDAGGSQVAELRHIEVHGIAQHHPAGRDDNGGNAPEKKLPVRARNDGGAHRRGA